MKIKFYLHNQPDKQGMKRLYCSYAHARGSGERPVRFPVVYNDMNIVVDPNYWIHDDNQLKEGVKKRRYSKKDKPQRVEASYRNAGLINSIISEYESNLEKLALEISKEGLTPSPARVKQAFWSQKKSILFWDAFEEFLVFKSKSVKAITLKAYSLSLRKMLTDYEKQKGRLSFSRMHRHFDTDFASCFRGKKQMSYIKITIGNLKNFLSWAYDMGYMKDEFFRRWKTPNSVSIKPALTLDDIGRIYRSCPDEKMDRFLWLFWTGQRFSESCNIVSLDGDVLSFYQAKRKRGNTAIYQIYLTPPAKKLWEKYDGIPWEGLSDPSNLIGAIRTRLKKIPGFERKVNTTYGLKPLHDSVGSHTGRISLITAMRELGIDKGHVKNVVGHAGGDVTDHYDKASFDRGFKTMKHFWELVKDRFEGYI